MRVSAEVVRSILEAALPSDRADEVVQRLELVPDADGDRYVSLGSPHTFWGEVRRASGDPLVGLRAALRVEPSVFGTFQHLLLSFNDLRGAIDVVLRYMLLINSGHRAGIAVEEGRAYFEWRSMASREDADFCSLLSYRLVKRLIPEFRLVEMRLPHMGGGEHERAEYEEAFGCPVVFGADAAVAIFDAAYLDVEIAIKDDSEGDLDGEDEMSHGEFAHRVEHAYTEAVSNGTDDAASVARRLGVSERTLRRKLHSLGTSHREKRDRARYAVAEQLLARSNVTLAEIASRVGFSEVSAFSRAFRRWTGTTPGAFRRRRAVG